MTRLLIADDSPAFRHFLRKCVAQMQDVEVVGEARHGEDALAKIAELKPDVLTLDMTMPRMNGMQVLQTMKQDYPNLPAIVLTSSNESEAELTVAALDAGAFDFIFKPKASDG
ncbi:MAG: response regulator, partial [Mariprofundaceae bacterium]|nr:response regulator [Mariprofundaceae bacterium]